MTGWITPVVAQVLLFALLAGMAASVDTDILKERFRKCGGIFLGLSCQFLILPFAGFAAAKLSGLGEIYGFALLCVTSSPGGAYSNWWCSIFNADLALSIAMTTCSTLTSLVFTPLNLIVYAKLAYGTMPNLDWFRLLSSIGVAVFSITFGLCVSVRWPRHRSCFNLVGNIAGLSLICFSALVSSRKDPIWDKDIVFYAAVASPCLLGLVLAFGVGHFSPCISGPEAVAVTVETSYQNTGLALTIALATFDEDQRAQAAGVPLFYAVSQVILLPLFLIFSWKAGLTYAPRSLRIDRVIREDFQPRSPSGSSVGNPGLPPVAATQEPCDIEAVVVGSALAANVHLESVIAEVEDVVEGTTAPPEQQVVTEDVVCVAPPPMALMSEAAPAGPQICLPLLASPTPEANAVKDVVVQVQGCGIPEFNGQYLPDDVARVDVADDRIRFRKVGGCVETIHHSNGYWHLGRNYAGPWYTSHCIRELPTSQGWTVGELGAAPPPEVRCNASQAGRAEVDIPIGVLQRKTSISSLLTWDHPMTRRTPRGSPLLGTRVMSTTPRGGPLEVQTCMPDGRVFNTEEPVELVAMESDGSPIPDWDGSPIPDAKL